jgi:hypothetical protein
MVTGSLNFNLIFLDCTNSGDDIRWWRQQPWRLEVRKRPAEMHRNASRCIATCRNYTAIRRNYYMQEKMRLSTMCEQRRFRLKTKDMDVHQLHPYTL